MALSYGGLEENLKCSICTNIFKDPVVLQCSHSFCKDCFEGKGKGNLVKECPLCKTTIKRHFKSQALKDVCESFRLEKKRRRTELNQGAVCTVHTEKHELFCLEDQKLVCYSCVAQDHKDHDFCAIGKAAEKHRNFRDIKQRATLPVPDPQLDNEPLIDVTKHLGILRYRVLDKMIDLCPYYPVILEPNAQTRLQVSQNLSTITCAPQPGSPTIPVKNHRCIMGSEGFSSGVHTWEVQVESCEQWFLGIVKESNRRAAVLSNSSYSVSVINGKCSWSPDVPKIKKVSILLDMKKGQVIFTDPDTNTTLKTFSEKFTEKMYPCFFVQGNSPMKIVPAKHWY